MKLRENFRVVATIDDRFPLYANPKRRDDHFEMVAKTLKEQVERHCDAQSVSIEWDTVCSHCGYAWEEEETGEPVCCQKAQEEFSENVKNGQE